MSHLVNTPRGFGVVGLLVDDGAEAVIHPEQGDLVVGRLGDFLKVILSM